MKDRNLAFVYTPEIERLSYPADCPFKTQRAGLTRQRLAGFGLLGSERQAEVVPRRATLAELQRFHPPGYLEELQRAAGGDLTIEGLHLGLGGSDTPVFKDLFEYGSWACGAALTAAELLLAESVCTWPPKHRTRENDSALPPASSLPLPPNFPSASELFPPSRSALQARRRKLGVWLTAGLCALGLAIVVYGFATNGRRSEPSLESWSREEPSEPTTDILAAEK